MNIRLKCIEDENPSYEKSAHHISNIPINHGILPEISPLVKLHIIPPGILLVFPSGTEQKDIEKLKGIRKKTANTICFGGSVWR
jgi:hypothetical protein